MGMNVFGSIVVNLGINIIKLEIDEGNESDSKEPEMGCEDDEGGLDTEKRNSKKNKYLNIVGFSLFFLGSVVNFGSFAFAAQSLLASLGGVQFICNCFFGHFILGETITIKHIFATMLLTLGVIIAVIFSNHTSEIYTLKSLMNNYDEEYLKFGMCAIVFVIVCEFVYKLYEKRDKDIETQEGGVSLEDEEESNIQLLDVPLERFPHAYFIKPITYSFASAIIGTQAVLQSKCVAEILKYAYLKGSWRILVSFELAAMIVVFAACICIWMKRLHFALQMFDGLLIIPMLQACWVLSAIIQGGFFFKEFTKQTPTQLKLFGTGVSIIMLGTVLLARAYIQSKDSHKQLSSRESSLTDGPPTEQQDEDRMPSGQERQDIEKCETEVIPPSTLLRARSDDEILRDGTTNSRISSRDEAYTDINPLLSLSLSSPAFRPRKKEAPATIS